jgi:hypothetical protein
MLCVTDKRWFCEHPPHGASIRSLGTCALYSAAFTTVKTYFVRKRFTPLNQTMLAQMNAK